MNNHIKLIECPRDAMQGWKNFIPTEKKIEYINSLLKVGFDTIDFGSFVSAKAIPQMADTAEVARNLESGVGNSKLLAIVANLRGAEEASQFDQITFLGFPFSVSETFQQRNTNSSIAESLKRVEEIQNLCINKNKKLVIYISMAFGNPYGDLYDEDIVFNWVEKLMEIDIDIISLADTVGVATPEQVYDMTSYLVESLPATEIGVHLHSTFENWQQKLDAAVKAGCNRFDGALKGIGGCPMANDELVGNMNTEWMISYFEKNNIATGLSKEALAESLRIAGKFLFKKMQFQLPIQIKSPEARITYRDKIMLTGSCFTEHIGNSLEELKFSTLQNPNGILFDPRSVCSSLISYIENKQYKKEDLFYLNEIWNSWEHHSRFSNINADEALKIINESQQEAYNFLKNADWLIITLGSSFSYRLTAEATMGGLQNNYGVANCHRAPSQWFNKHLLTIDETVSLLDTTYHRLKQSNPKLKIIFTISPVRHIRDGVIENNRSKARLIEAVHHMINKFPGLYYFPAYELVIDVLRDYRFYDIDMVHPNYPATEFVMEKFNESFIDEQSQQLMEEIKKIVIARKHKAFQPETNAHKTFLKTHLEKTKELQSKFSFLDLNEEINYFKSA